MESFVFFIVNRNGVRICSLFVWPGWPSKLFCLFEIFDSVKKKTKSTLKKLQKTISRLFQMFPLHVNTRCYVRKSHSPILNGSWIASEIKISPQWICPVCNIIKFCKVVVLKPLSIKNNNLMGNSKLYCNIILKSTFNLAI